MSVIDLMAPIFPGSAAAGVYLGMKAALLLEVRRPIETEKLGGCTRLRFGEVDVWVERGKITQVGLFTGYRGTIDGKIGIGTMLGAVADLWGAVRKHRDGLLVVERLPGWGFEFDGWENVRKPQDRVDEALSAIFIFPVTA
jgi:hypothetical protein